MKKYWDMVEVGHTLKTIKKPPISRGQIAQFAAGSFDFSPLNLDDDYAKNAGFHSAFASNLMCLAAAEDALRGFAVNMNIVSLTGTFQRLIWPGDSLIANGLVVRRYQKNDEHRIKVTVWCENQSGELVMKGNAQCALFADAAQEAANGGSVPAISAINRTALQQKCEQLVNNALKAKQTAPLSTENV